MFSLARAQFSRWRGWTPGGTSYAEWPMVLSRLSRFWRYVMIFVALYPTSQAPSKDIVRLDGFLAHRYPVERFAFNGVHLVSGAHKEVKIWFRSSEGESCGFFSRLFSDCPIATRNFVADLPAPRRSSYTTACDIIVTSLHWISTPQYPSLLLVTYLSHGIA